MIYILKGYQLYKFYDQCFFGLEVAQFANSWEDIINIWQVSFK